MLRALGVFLVGALVLAIIIYISNLLIGLMVLPAAVAQIALIIIGLLGLLALIYLTVRAFNQTGSGPTIL